MRLGQALDLRSGRAWKECDHAREVEYRFDTALLNRILAHAQPGTTLIFPQVANLQVIRTVNWELAHI